MQTNLFTYALDAQTQVTGCNLYVEADIEYHFFFIVTDNSYRIESTVMVDSIYNVCEEMVGTWSGIYWEDK